MPLNDDAINQILPFAPEGNEAAGDLLALEQYREHPMRLRGHQPGLALRELQNRTSRQSAHMAAGLAQFIANRFPPGVKDDGDLDKVEEGLFVAIFDMILDAIPEPASPYDLCEFYYFRHPVLKPGFQPAQGGVISGISQKFPEVVPYLQTTEGQMLCTTEAEWQAMTTATWATLADGSKVGWNGIGGAPFYVLDVEADTLRLPDLRGMYAEAAGYDALGVGGVHGDAIRQIPGVTAAIPIYGSGAVENNNAFLNDPVERTIGAPASGSGYRIIRNRLIVSRVAPTAAKNQPRAWGALACVYLGQPAS